MLDRPDSDLILRTDTALGNGMIEGVRTIIYIRPESFDSLITPSLALSVARINAEMAAKGEGYILIGRSLGNL